MTFQVENCKIIRRIQKKYHVHAKHDPNNAHITEIIVTIKHRLSVKSQRIEGYKEGNRKKQQSGFFY